MKILKTSETHHQGERLNSIDKIPIGHQYPFRAAKVLTNKVGQIAAIAKVNSLVLVTRNIADFDLFSGLDVQNWFE